MSKRAVGGLVALTFVTAVLLLALLVGAAAGGHGKGKGPKPPGTHGRIGFHFLVVDVLPGTPTPPDRLILQGNGSFNRNRASGGGTFDHFLACPTGTVCPLVATGTWKATDVVSWTPGTSHGVFQGGILVIHATFKPQGQPPIKNVMLEVDCNLGPAAFNTGKTEGVIATFPGTPPVVYTPTTPANTGLTVFTLTKGHKH